MLTKYLAKVLGLWIVLALLGMIFARHTSVTTMNALFTNPPLMWVTGVFTMLVGLIVVVLHNRWSGGALPVIVTLYGWIALVKGVSLVWLRPEVQSAAWRSLQFDRFFIVYVVVALAIGGYLIYGGFTAPRHRPAHGEGERKVRPDTWPTVPRH